ncbi:MAG: Uma2 family endonuclease [Butyricicoccus sp.]|nr:Uma2 family endonuclease [Butyricicoccus sp.]
MGSQSVNHAFVRGNIYFIFANYLNEKNLTPVPGSTDLHLTEKDIFVPDGMVVCDPDKIRYDGVHGAPDLVVEVLSPSTAKYDRGRKKDAYEKCGVREYWIVDPANKTVEQYLLQSGKFVLHDTYAILPDWMLGKMKPEERAALVTEFKCSLYDDLTIHLDDVFARVK